jgi:hypothetical protein
MDTHNMHPQEHAGGMHPKPPPKEEPPPDPTFGGHGQLIVGTGPIYLSHLPMFMFNPEEHPHNFQVLLEVTFTASDGSDPQDPDCGDPEETYVVDRRHKLGKMYTLRPEKFVMLDLVRPDPQHGKVRSFTGEIYKNHFERPGHELLCPAVVNVEHVVYFQEFDPHARPLPALEYLLFGKRNELFLAHRITRPPDFDHVLAVKFIGHRFTDDELRNAIRITVPGRPNELSSRLQENETVTGQAHLEAAGGSAALDVELQIGREFYFEADELSGAM